MAWPFKRKRGQKLTSPDGLPVVNFPPTWLGTVNLSGLRGSYGYIYRTQPNVRAVVDFLASEAASVKLKLYEKVPSSPELPDGRLEDPEHPMMLVLNHPNPSTTRTRLWFHTVADFHVYDIAFWRKIRQSGQVRALLRVPPVSLFTQRDPLTRQIVAYTDAFGNQVSLNDLVIFKGYDPELYDGNVSPLETLRRVLAEEQAAGQQREGMWRNGARREGVVSRPLEAPSWSPEAREAWRADFEATMAGAHNAGRVGLLEDGMSWNADSFNPKEMEYLGARLLTRKECASAFRVDPRMVFASDDLASPEVRTGFYVDRLVPLLTGLQEEIDLQLLPDFETVQRMARVYTEFNIDAKLRGSFEEQAKILVMTTGVPIVARNEARARLNLPPKAGGDELATPMNVLVGGQASPQSPLQTPGDMPALGQTPNPAGTTPQAASMNFFFNPNGEMKVAAETPPEDILRTAPKAALRRREEVANRYQTLLNKHLTRQGARIMKLANAMRTKTPGSLDLIWGDQARWDLELSADLQKLTQQVVDENARRAIRQLSRKAKYNPDRTRNFIKKATLTAAISINAKTREDVSQALSDESGDALEAVFSDTGRTAVLGTSFGTSMINFARNEGATQGGGRTKTWIVTSANSRHPEMNGETVSLNEDFSNGLPWPGAWGDVEQSANCQCLVDLG